jgi:Lipopolysaccharide kinase (Kdo/WaaP) family
MLAELARPPATHRHGRVEVHPAVAASITRVGLVSASDFLELPGEVVSGHPDRHVMQVVLDAGGEELPCYLKRQHRVRWKERWNNWLAGAGFVSRSEREGRLLLALEDAGLPAPCCLAFGEDGCGRAFLLVRAAEGHIDLHRWLSKRNGNVGDISERLGRLVAEVHNAGFDHPDLYAKHVLVHPETDAVMLIDWQRSRRWPSVSWSHRIRTLAALHATIAKHLVPLVPRLRFLRAYLEATCRHAAGVHQRPGLAVLARRVAIEADRLLRKPSVRSQQLPEPGTEPQRLVWLDGEALCAIPEVAGGLQDEPWRLRLYDARHQSAPLPLPCGRVGRLRVGRARISLRRLWCLVRRRTWRSPELRMARLLFLLERHRIPAPRLLAFGQRGRTLGRAESFVLSEPHAMEGTLLGVWLDDACRRVDKPEWCKLRRQVLDSVADLLRRLHDAGCIVEQLGRLGEPFVVHANTGPPAVVLADVGRLHYLGRARPKDVRADLRRLWWLVHGAPTRGDALQFLMRYLRVQSITPCVRRLLEEV